MLTELSQKTFACFPSHPQNSSRVVLCGSSNAVSTVSAHATGILHRHLTPRFVLVQHVPSLLALPLLSSCIAHAPCFLSQCPLLSDPPALKQKQQQVETSVHAPGQGSRAKSSIMQCDAKWQLDITSDMQYVCFPPCSCSRVICNCMLHRNHGQSKTHMCTHLLASVSVICFRPHINFVTKTTVTRF